jgi:zinc transport system substrate-binding protein
MLRQRTIVIVCAAAGLVCAGGGVWAQPAVEGGGVAVAAARKPIEAVVSIAPLKGLVEALLPAGSRVQVIIPPGVSEHGYETPPSMLRSVLGADLVVIVGRGIEPSIEKILLQNPRPARVQLTLSDFAVGVGEKDEHKHSEHNDDEHKHEEHKHGEEGHVHDDTCEHGGHGAHGNMDPHVWLDPLVMKRFVTSLDASLNPGPASSAGPSARATELLARIDAVDVQYREMMANATRKVCVVGHDAWSIVSSRYGFTALPIAGLHASEPTPTAIAAAVGAAREHGATMLLVEPQISDRVAKRVAASAKLELGKIDALGNGDWFAMMEANRASFARAFGVPAPQAR